MSIFTRGQLTVVLDSLAARIDAVLPAFGVERIAGVEIEARERPDKFCEELVIHIPIRRREAV